MAYTLRQARIEDAEALTELGRVAFVQNFGHLYTEKNLAFFLDHHYTPQVQAAEITDPDSHILLVCAEGGRLAGYAKSGPCKLPVEQPLQPAYELQRLYLLPEAQGTGAGAALMRDALEFFRDVSAASVYIGVWEKNFRAQAFYRKFGFEQISSYHFMVGDHADNEFILQMQAWRSQR